MSSAAFGFLEHQIEDISTLVLGPCSDDGVYFMWLWSSCHADLTELFSLVRLCYLDSFQGKEGQLPQVQVTNP